MLRDGGVRVLGGVENMTGLACPHCGEPIELFPRVREDRALWTAGVDRLGGIPFDPAVARAAEQGRPLGDGPALDAFRRLARAVLELLPEAKGR
jgi:hypothetical protein